MTETDNHEPQGRGDEEALEAFFQEARTEAARPMPGDLLARVMADAEALRPGRKQPLVRRIAQRLSDGFGGWPAMAGLATATVAGLWFGFSWPAATDALAGGALGLTAGVADYPLDDLIFGFQGAAGILTEG